MKNLLLWIMETRPQFLTLSVVLAFLGTAIAWYYGTVNIGYALLAGFGLMLTHGSVNAINDYFDYKSGIDLNVERTPFSGGSGLVPGGKLPLNQTLWVGTVTFLVALLIGIFFIAVKGWLLLPLIVAAALCLVLYTPVILKTPWPEWSPGLGLGILPILGFYFVQAGRYDWMVLIASIPSGIMVHNLLLLNEFPDVEADRKGGRKTTPVLFGMDAAAKLFSIATIAVYGWIVACALATFVLGRVVMPVYCLIALLALPWAVKAIRGSKEYRDRARLIPAMADNVTFILLTHVLLGVGYILEKLFPMF
ncbi:1,4-dihydroxy-2-naphthoate octaprenyltransferase [Desulfosarcina widdelii]|uniref:1,4-dihydroxy-2-naphthoate octaprenyltransferase n=1 Tax=Desulfosarcina widdelii TaxID=947919 RepID=A0A5K7ZF97_9BACT|nr:prenyltransferase [Desulfosarcina widdelii]BBO78471.1 1,4-dihydroxy-2-naphthoate octaprenyltransferase [Desulfosarcina widdelii]